MEHNWLDKTAYPFHSNYFDLNGHQLHYIDEGAGETLLFIHGTPSWSFEYRKIIHDLKSDYRCMAIDHIGFGLSDKPADYDYSTQKHAQTLERFILEKDLTAITLVVHDFGGPIGLDVTIRNPDRIKRIVVLNSWMWSSENEPEFIQMRKILKSPLLPFLYRYFNFSAKFLLPRSFGDKKIDKKTLKQYTRPFANKAQRKGTIAFAKSLLNDQQWFESLWKQKAVISDKPVLFIWGMKDPLIKAKNLEKFELGFKTSRTVKLQSCGHFPQEEEPGAVIDAIKEFMETEW